MNRFVTSLLLAAVNMMAVLAINELRGWEKGLMLGMYASVVAYAVCEAAASHGMFG